MNTDLTDLVLCLSNAIDLANNSVSTHNRQVALIAYHLAGKLGLSSDRRMDAITAGLLHDIGALSLKDRLNLHNFEVQNAEVHSELGYRHIRHIGPLEHVAVIVRHHHARWGDRAECASQVDDLSYLLHLADRIAVLIDRNEEILEQSPRIIQLIRARSGDYFKPEHVDAFMDLAGREFFWLTAAFSSPDRLILDAMTPCSVKLGNDDLLDFSRMIGKVIDYRSSFTAVHSSRVSAVADLLARLSGMNGQDCLDMKIAGYLHDIGKLAVPPEIIDKPSKLSAREWNIMKSHAFYTFKLLDIIGDFNKITQWACTHHEQLNGSGYPFHLTEGELSLGQRILAVADIFTALTEDRPYRGGMDIGSVIRVMKELALTGVIDAEVFGILTSHGPELDRARKMAEDEVIRDYGKFVMGVDFSST